MNTQDFRRALSAAQSPVFPLVSFIGVPSETHEVLDFVVIGERR
jgi:hypothetical protein